MRIIYLIYLLTTFLVIQLLLYLWSAPILRIQVAPDLHQQPIATFDMQLLVVYRWIFATECASSYVKRRHTAFFPMVDAFQAPIVENLLALGLETIKKDQFHEHYREHL